MVADPYQAVSVPLLSANPGVFISPVLQNFGSKGLAIDVVQGLIPIRGAEGTTEAVGLNGELHGVDAVVGDQ